jgi:outer membrane immunogenic protein
MKKHVLGAIPFAVLVTIGSASAADMPVRRPVSVPPVVAPFSWSGCYVGGYAGGGWNGGDGATFTDQGQNGLGAAGSTAVPPFLSYSGGATSARLVPAHSWSTGLGGSFVGGGTVGCNWQASGSPYVFGLEGELGYMHLKGRAFDPATIVSTQTTLDVLGSGKAGEWYGMMAGRLGYAWDRTLLYVKGGAAFVPTRGSVVDACQDTAAGCGNWLIATAGNRTVTTWALGGGLEWAFAQSWSVKAEYMFIGLNNEGGFLACGPVTTPAGTILGGGPFCFNTAFGGIHTAKIGLNYRLGWTGL